VEKKNNDKRNNIKLVSLNEFELKLNQPIYRYTNFTGLLELLEGKNKLTKPHKWSDPSEGFMRKLILYKSESEQIAFCPVKHRYFAQCWTLKKECNLMWETYCPNKQGIKIKTTIKKLLNIIQQSGVFKHLKKITKHEAKLYYGKIGYYHKKHFLNNPFFDFTSAIKKAHGREGSMIIKNEFVKSYFIKRKSFSNEKEFRIVMDIGLANYFPLLGNTCDFKCENLIDEIIFDYRFFAHIVDEDDKQKVFEQYSDIIKRTGFSGKLEISTLGGFDLGSSLKKNHQSLFNNKEVKQ
jgi:hypothetical protein